MTEQLKSTVLSKEVLKVIPVSYMDLIREYKKGTTELINLLYQLTLKYNFHVCAGQLEQAQKYYKSMENVRQRLNKKENKNV